MPSGQWLWQLVVHIVVAVEEEPVVEEEEEEEEVDADPGYRSCAMQMTCQQLKVASSMEDLKPPDPTTRGVECRSQ